MRVVGPAFHSILELENKGFYVLAWLLCENDGLYIIDEKQLISVANTIPNGGVSITIM